MNVQMKRSRYDLSTLLLKPYDNGHKALRLLSGRASHEATIRVAGCALSR